MLESRLLLSAEPLGLIPHIPPAHAIHQELFPPSQQSTDTGPRVVAQQVNVVGDEVTIDLTFNEPVDPTTLNGENLVFDRFGGDLTLLAEVSDDNNVASFNAIDVVGELAYVTGLYDGAIYVFDVADPSLPQQIGKYSFYPSDPLDLAVQDGIAYVASEHYSAEYRGVLHVLDVSDPAQISVLHEYLFEEDLHSVQLVGGRAYVTDDRSRLHILDVSDPTSITPLGEYQIATSPGVVDFQVVNDTAYAIAAGALYALDVSDPQAVSELGSYQVAGDFLRGGVAVSGDRAFTSLVHSEELLVLDISNLAAITELGSFELYNNNIVSHIELVGSLAYVSTSSGPNPLQLLDVSDPSHIARVGNIAESLDAEVIGGTAYSVSGLLYTVALPTLDFTGSITSLGNNTWRLTQWLPDGAYQLQVGTGVLDASGNPMDQDADGILGEAREDVFIAQAFTADGVPPRIDSHHIFQDRTEVVSFDLNFSTPIDAATLNASTVLFDDGSNVIGYNGVPKLVEDGVYRLDQSLPAGTYTIKIGPDILDSANNPMDQDLDGIAGEPLDDVYSISGVVVDPSPRVLTHDFNGLGNAVTVDLQFSEPIDPASLNRNTIFFDQPAGDLALLEQVGGAYNDVELVGSLAYVLDSAGIRVLDVSTPAAPQQLGRLLLPETPEAVSVAGGIAYVAAGDAGLRILDVSDPGAIAIVATHETTGFAQNISVLGGTAYVSLGEAGLEVLDISDPVAVSRLGGYDTYGTVEDIHAVDDLAYVADGYNGLVVLDISDPGAITYLGRYASELAVGLVQVVGTTAYIDDSKPFYHRSLVVLDVTDPATIVRTGSFGITSLGSINDLEVADGIAYLADTHLGLHALDVSDLMNIRLLDRYNLPDNRGGAPFRVAVADGAAYLVGGEAGLDVLDVSNPATIIRAGGLRTTDPHDIQVLNNMAYVASGLGGLQVWDVSDPADAILAGEYFTPYSAVAVELVGSTAYVLDQRSGLFSLDVSDAANISLLDSYETGGYNTDLRVAGDRAYVTNTTADDTLQVFDVSDRSNIVWLGAGRHSHPLAIDVAGTAAYVVGRDELRAFDVYDPDSIEVQESWRSSNVYGADVQVLADRAYLAYRDSGLRVLDISDPSNFTEVGQFTTNGVALSVHVVGQVAYVGTEQGSLYVLDVSNPAAITSLTTYQMPGSVRSVQVAHGVVYAAGGGLWSFALPGAAFDGAVNDLGNNRYQLTQTLQPGAYSLRVGARVVDLTGNPMDQDSNGVDGTAGDVFSFAFQMAHLNGTTGSDHYHLVRNGEFAEIRHNSAQGTLALAIPLDRAEQTLLNTGGGSDRLTIDFVAGNPIPSGGVQFVGGIHADAITVLGDSNAQHIAVFADEVLIDGKSVWTEGVESVYVDARGGNDVLELSANTTITGVQELSSLTIADVTVFVADSTVFTSALSIASGGALDIGENHLIIRNGSEFAIGQLIASGYSGGGWSGVGIRSSAASISPVHAVGYASNANLGYSSFGGVSVGSTDILVRYTKYGDSDLSGDVSFTDLSLFVAGYNAGGSGWLYGDYNFSGSSPDFDDLTLFIVGFIA